MAAVELTLSGVFYDKIARTSRPGVFIGEGFVTGLGVGGGPIYPPDQGGGGGSPPGIWGGGNVPMPNPPIANVPGAPGYRPPGDGIWGPGDPRPNPPIANVPGLPPTTDPPPIDPSTPPIEWKVVWHPTEGWLVVGVPNFPHPSPSE